MGLMLASRCRTGAGDCGANTGVAATGAPIWWAASHGNAAPGDFSASTQAAAAYFACVNANGGIHGRPIEYLVENDQWNPELAAQAASKLITDRGVVAMVGNGSFVEMAVNARTYQDANIMAMARPARCRNALKAQHRFDQSRAAGIDDRGGAIHGRRAREQDPSLHRVCHSERGPWSCGAMEEYMTSKGLTGSSVLSEPGLALT
jgi:branched-chain amino acid transport system substrate-binding protein